jgi:hypothetical protein
MDAPREKTFLLAGVESRVLTWIARRLPRTLHPDHMTALGVLAAIGIAAAYALSNQSPLWLWAASALLVVHWLGDSLDGTLARVRGSSARATATTSTPGRRPGHGADRHRPRLSPHMLLRRGC